MRRAGAGGPEGPTQRQEGTSWGAAAGCEAEAGAEGPPSCELGEEGDASCGRRGRCLVG